MTPAGPPQVPTTTLDTYDPAAVLLDVREPGEFDAGHAAGALNIPLGQLAQRLGEIPSGDVVVTCRSGGRSAKATAQLLASGRTAANLEGGMTAWSAAGRPLVSGNGTEPRVI